MKDYPETEREAPAQVYNWRIYALAIAASMGSAMFGYDAAFIGGTLVLPSFQSHFGFNQAGCFFGAICSFFLNEKWGRKISIMICGVLFDLGAIIQVAASGRVGMIYGGRILTGLAVGASSLTVPMYIAECSPPAIRGKMIGIFEVSLQAFQVIGYWVNFGVNRNVSPNSNSQWQIPFAFQLVPGTLLVLGMFFQPESPRWLIKDKRRDKALVNLMKIRNLPEDHEYIQWEIESVVSQIKREQEQRSPNQKRAFLGILQEMMKPGQRNRVLLGMAMMMFQNLVGANAINYFSPSIFTSIGFKGTSISLLATGVYGIVKVCSTLFFILVIVDRVGRRVPLLAGSVGAFAAMLYLGIYTKLSGSFDARGADKNAAAYVAIVMIYIYAICFCLSWNSIAWIFCAEIFPLEIRSVCLVLTTCTQWLGQFIIVYSTPYMIADIKFGTFIFFAASIFCGSIFAYFCIPETKGFSLEDMDLIFDAKGTAVQKRRSAEGELAARSFQPGLVDVKDSSSHNEYV